MFATGAGGPAPLDEGDPDAMSTGATGTTDWFTGEHEQTSKNVNNTNTSAYDKANLYEPCSPENLRWIANNPHIAGKYANLVTID